MEILTNNNNPVTLKLIISSIFTKIDVNIKIITENDAKSKNLKELPTFSSETGLKLNSSNAASKYLFPPHENIINSVNQLLEWEFGTLTPVLLNNMATKSEPSNKSELLKCFIKLETLLAKQPFLSGNVISVADISIFSMLYPLFSSENEYGNNYPKLNRWFTNFKNLPEVQDALKRYPVSHGKAAYLVILESIPESFQNIYMQSVKVITEETKATGSPSHQAVDAVTPSELLKAEESWKNINSIAKPKSCAVPVVPVEGERNILITSALPYVNNVPHLGNIIGCVLSADVFARYCRLCNYNTLYICGTDEYGTATETKALAENTTPQQICDKYFQIHNDIYRWFGIGFDYFGRTTTAEQTEICQEMFLKILSNGFIITQSVEQLFCPKCERFLADRFVEGGCPQLGCGYEDARGDQCDGCGKLVNATELKNPRCKLCSTTPKIQSSEQFFLDLPKIEPILKLWMQDSCSGWSNNARVIGQSWIKEGLKPRCITRDLKWGIPVPLEQYNKKVFYVWFDAPIGYMSITKRYAPKDWLKWWKPETKSMSIELHQFMAKDNVPFHAVMFPATLLAANEGHTKVTNLWATEYLNYEDGKFSKSRGVGVFGNDARDTGISADVWRFYLTYVRPESQDSSFSWVDLATKNNSELLNNLGNFVNRALVFAEKNFNSVIQDITPNVEDYTLFALCSRELTGYVAALDKARLRDGIRHILSISRHGNQYMQANQPWVLCKGNPEERARAGTVIGISCNLACLLAILIHPYMPETSRVMKQQLNAPDSIFVLNPSDPVVSNLLPAGHKLGKPSPLFSKIEDTKVEELKAKYAGMQQTEEKKVSTKPKQTENQKENQKLVGDPAELSRIEQEITKQGEIVRTLKTNGAEKSVWQPEVTKLLELKAKLVAMGGAVAPPPTSKSKKNKK